MPNIIKNTYGAVIFYDENSISWRDILSKASQMNICLDRADLSEINISNFEFANMSLIGAQFNSAIIKCCKFTNCNLSKALFLETEASMCEFYSCNITDADFFKANLSASIFSHITFGNANFSSALLAGTKLSFANLADVNLFDAEITGADFSFAKTFNMGLILAGHDSRGHLFYAQQNPMSEKWEIVADCHKFSIEEAVAYWSDNHKDNPVIRTECLLKVQYLQDMIAAYEQFNNPKMKGDL